MGQKERADLIKRLEEKRGCRLICFLTGDRQPGLGTQIGMDVFPFFYEILVAMGKQEKIDLLLYSTGGAIMAAWGLVNLLREFCDRLRVLIPFKAQSSATLIALGANEIIMTRTGQLSPVDPTVTSAFNPVLPNQVAGAQPQFLPVSVEDVVGFMNLVREEGRIKDEKYISEAMRALTTDVRPLALGSVYRAKEQIRMLSRKLLSFHLDKSEEARIESIVSALTRDLYSHDYVIARKEAKDVLGLKIAECPEDLEKVIMELFLNYAQEMQLTKSYNAQVELGDRSTRVVTLDRAYIESTEKSFVFRTKREIKKLRITQDKIPLDVFQEKVLEEGWTGS